MNILELLYVQFLATFQPSFHGYRAVLKMLELQYHKNQAGNIGIVHTSSKSSLLIPAGHTAILKDSAKVTFSSLSKRAVVEHLQTLLPGGLYKSCLVTLPSQSADKVPVVLSNKTEQDIFHDCCSLSWSMTCIIFQYIVSLVLKLNFGESPIPPEWKQCIIENLSEMQILFSHCNLDFGYMHPIKLHDDTHRARPIHPQDVEDVSITIKDAYGLPNLEEAFSALNGAKWFFVLDL